MVKADTVAKLARAWAAALSEFADEVLAEASTAGVVVQGDEGPADPLQQYLGPRQREIVQLPGLASEAGMTTGEVGREIGYDQPNVYLTLQSLSRRGIVERVPGSAPHRYRLAPKYRGSSSPYLRLAELVQEGEWTTYGDISIAQRGDTRAARAVGRAAATLANFPNPHRILLDGGRIPPTWHDDQGGGPEECRRRLEKEGVRFTDEGRADAARRISWDVLAERAAEGAR
jgi:alkylated DNA nucleotide flippase Atl1